MTRSTLLRSALLLLGPTHQTQLATFPHNLSTAPPLRGWGESVVAD